MKCDNLSEFLTDFLILSIRLDFSCWPL